MVKLILREVKIFILTTILRNLPDVLYVRLFYFAAYGKFPNLRNPVTFDEKIQWYKLNYKKSLMTQLADKYAVREYVKNKGMGHILNDLYFVKDSLSDEDFEDLPDKYVIKTTHGCGMNVINDGSFEIDRKKIISEFKKWLKQNWYYRGREWAYKNIEPKVICEKYLENAGSNQLIDYKFYCYGGKPQVLFVCAGRFDAGGVKYNAYDMDWKRIYVIKGKPGLDTEFDKPDNFEEMKETAKTLSGDFPFVRVDLYSIKNRIYFGELTFYPDNGIIPFSPDEFNKFFGDFFKLPERTS